MASHPEIPFCQFTMAQLTLTFHPGNQFDRALQRRSSLSHVTPHIADSVHTFEDVPYRERGGLHFTPLDLLPCARRRHGCTAARSGGVRRGILRVIAVSAGVDLDAPASIGLAERRRH